MPIVADAAVAIRGDLSKFNQDLKGADKPIQNLGGRIKAALSPQALVGGLAAGFAATKVLDFLGDAVTAASDLNETVSKTGQVLGQEALPELERWAEGAAQAFGQSKRTALDAASTFAIFGKSAGLAGDDLVGFSTELTELSADFASFFNTSPEDAITAIGAALRGESEPIRRYGILLDDATLRQRALKLGIIATTSQALTPQQRVLAAQAEILAQSADAQGDFARTSEGLANQQRILAAEMENASAELGEKLLPVMLKLTHFMIDFVVPAFGFVVDAISLFGNAIGFIPARIGEAADAIREFLGVENTFVEKQKWAADEAEREQARIAESTKRNADAAASHYMAMGRDAANALAGSAGDVADGMEKMVAPVETEWEKAHKAAVTDARALPGDLAQALKDGQADVESGMEALTTLMEESLSDAAKVAYLKGVLASDELAAGLIDERADVRASALALKEEAERQLELLESGAADAAVDAGTTFAEQLRLKSAAAGQAAAVVAQRAQQMLKFNAYSGGASSGQTFVNGLAGTLASWSAATQVQNALQLLKTRTLGGSLPKSGPLAHPEVGARSIALAWLQALGDTVNSGLPLRDLALGSLQPAMATPALGAVANPTSLTQQWILNVDGIPRTVDSKQAALDELERLGETWG